MPPPLQPLTIAGPVSSVSAKFAKELLDAMTDSWSKYATVRGIQNLPEAPPRNS